MYDNEIQNNSSSCLDRHAAFQPLAVADNNHVEASNPQFFQPDAFYMKVYEMGLLASNPGDPDAPGESLDFSSAVKVFQSAAGEEVQVLNGVSSPLSGTITRPPEGTYSYAYVVIEPMFRVKAKLLAGGTTYYSKASVASDAKSYSYSYEDEPNVTINSNYYNARVSSNIADWGVSTVYMNSFSGTGESYRWAKPGGGMFAYLTTSGYVLGSGASKGSDSALPGNGTITRLVGIIPMSVTVTSSMNTMDLSFKVLEGASAKHLTSTAGRVLMFGGGPFNINLSLR